MQLEFIPCTIKDIAQLVGISKQTFYDAYTDSNAIESLDRYVRESFTEGKLSEEIQNPESLFYLAWVQNNLAGYLKLNFGQAQTDIKDLEAMEIERIYLAKDYWGVGLGEQMLLKALDIAKKSDLKYVWLGVWEENPRAIRFYEKYGFKSFSSHHFVLGEEVQTDILMKLDLRNS